LRAIHCYGCFAHPQALSFTETELVLLPMPPNRTPIALVAIGLLCTIGSADAAPIERNLNAYFIGTELLIAAVCLTIGCLVIARARNNRRKAQACLKWPTVMGKILSSTASMRIQPIVEYGGIGYFVPEVRYTYQVDGTRYESNHLQFGFDRFSAGSKRRAGAIAARYPVNAEVPVYFDPANPSVAVLMQGDIGSRRSMFSGITLICLALIALAFSAYSI
jgi:hypothetical protein